jgi:hypothetical protein
VPGLQGQTRIEHLKKESLNQLGKNDGCGKGRLLQNGLEMAFAFQCFLATAFATKLLSRVAE